MTGDQENQQNIDRERAKAVSISWASLKAADVAQVDFEGPITASNSAECQDLNSLFRAAAELQRSNSDGAVDIASQLFDMLADVTGFYFKPSNRDAPYSAMISFADRRSAIPEDFRGEPLSVIAAVAERAQNSVLKARLNDVCWLLERRRINAARSAIAAYVAVVESLASGIYYDRSGSAYPLLSLTACDALRRALTISRVVNWDCDEALTARAMTQRARDYAFEVDQPSSVLWLSEIDLEFAVSPAGEIGEKIEEFLENSPSERSSFMDVQLWRLAGQAYHRAKDKDAKYRCISAAAETLVKQSQEQKTAIQTSHWLSAAIAEYHGVPEKRERRAELRQKLIESQSQIPHEMESFSQSISLKDMVEEVEKQFDQSLQLIDMLMKFVGLEASPSPDRLRSEATDSIKAHIFSSLFGSSFHDDEGKVTFRSTGRALGDAGDSDSVRAQIAHHESLRRNIVVFGAIEVARIRITDRYFVSEDTFMKLFQWSAFVPRDVIMSFSRGIARFFSGDHISAVYILTPLLENSLRHILKLNGHDVTTFDAATQTQEDRTISAIFDQMRTELEGIFGVEIVADIENVFLLRPGPALRHSVAHGLLSDGAAHSADAIYGCWLIFRLACLFIFPNHNEIILDH